jgi:hypothetical protein
MSSLMKLQPVNLTGVEPTRLNITIQSNKRTNGRRAMRTYDRTWHEIEEMLILARERRDEWQQCFKKAQVTKDRNVMKDAAKNAKALEGVEKTLRWVLSEDGVVHPLD